MGLADMAHARSDSDSELERSLSDAEDAEGSKAYRLIVTNLPDSVFETSSNRDRFEGLFLAHSILATFEYLKNFRRARVSYLSEEHAVAARDVLNQSEFENRTINVYRASYRLTEIFKSGKHLKPPKVERTELISPPSSPPVGWVQVVESAPVVDYQLQAAVAGLAESGAVVELFLGSGRLPTINVVVCGD